MSRMVWLSIYSRGNGTYSVTPMRLRKIACSVLSYKFNYGHALNFPLAISKGISNPWLGPTCQLSSRLFSDDKAGDRRLEDILSESKEKKVKNQYPELVGKKHTKKSSLGNLLRELKGETSKDSLKSSTYKTNKLPNEKIAFYHRKHDPADRVSALNKHFNAIFLRKRNASSSLHQQQKLKFVPDDTEVGELLKSLTSKGKFTAYNVREIMSNIRPRSVGNERKANGNLDKNQGKNVFLSGKRGRSFTKESRLFNGPHSHYFDLSCGWDELDIKPRFTSVHERKWKQTVDSTVPKLGPTNAFEVLMLEADKLWKFPIDNEIGLDDEDKSTFEDHVFLSEYLEMFPVEGQIRRFMELVITGLQQNPYCSVKEKVDKIYWFKSYFDKFSDEDLEF